MHEATQEVLKSKDSSVKSQLRKQALKISLFALASSPLPTMNALISNPACFMYLMSVSSLLLAAVEGRYKIENRDITTLCNLRFCYSLSNTPSSYLIKLWRVQIWQLKYNIINAELVFCRKTEQSKVLPLWLGLPLPTYFQLGNSGWKIENWQGRVVTRTV